MTNEIFIDQSLSSTIDREYLKRFYDGDKFEVTFLFRSDFNNTKYIRDYLSIILDILNVNFLWKSRLILVSDELNNNAVEYGTAKDGINIFRFSAKVDGNDLILNIEVEDEGNGGKAKKASEMEILRDKKLKEGFDNQNSIRGRGLFLITTKLVDDLYFSDSPRGGLIVGIRKTLKNFKTK